MDVVVDETVAWLSGEGPEAPVALACESNLMRNLAEFSFTWRCSSDERAAVEERVLTVLADVGLFETGQYHALPGSQAVHDMVAPADAEERRWAERMLAERRLLSLFHASPRDGRDGTVLSAPDGAYVGDDQSVSVMVNGPDHVCIRVLSSGLDLLEGWARQNLVDDRLAEKLDYAFDDRHGYLSADLAHVGTGLKAAVLLHLPGLAMTGHMGRALDVVAERRHLIWGLEPSATIDTARADSAGDEDASCRAVDTGALYSYWYGTFHEESDSAAGDLYFLSNSSTLGVSEEEILHELRHVAEELVALEKAAREELAGEGMHRLEDRVSRAKALACSARVLGFSEALALLSSIRLGATTGLAKDCTMGDVNRLLIACQDFHVRAALGGAEDDLAVSAKRADLFRAHFATC